MTAILGISAFHHDSAAALVVDGRIVAAAQEERFTRESHDDAFPMHAVEYCLAAAGLGPEDLDYVAFYDKPYQKLERLWETYLTYAPAGFRSFVKAMPLWLKKRLHVRREIRHGLGQLYTKQCLFAEHHESHAASAFFPSPFEEAAVLVLDGEGEWATTSYGTGRGNRVEITHQQQYPHSLGLLYSTFAYYCGFDNGGEQKLADLAPYGEPKYRNLILDKLIDLKDDGSFRLDMRYFGYCHSSAMTSKKFERLFGGSPRRADEPPRQRDMDIAASIQQVTEDIMLRSAKHVHNETGLSNLCLAGDMALNRAGVGRLLRESPFDRVWIPPAPGDAGGALGVALLVWYQLLGNERTAGETDALLGAEYNDGDIESFLKGVSGQYEYFDSDEALCEEAAEAIAGGKVVGWFQGRMEFGANTAGSRSIFGDPRDPHMRSTVSTRVRFLEGFRPAVAIVLREHAHEYFDLAADHDSPNLPVIARVRGDLPREESGNGISGGAKGGGSYLTAVTQVNGTAHVQTLDPVQNPLLGKLMSRFHDKTGCPVMLHAPFGLGWEPIVRSPEDAYETFMSSGIDVLCMGRFVIRKQAQLATVTAVVDSTSDEIFEGKLASPCCRSELTVADGRLTCRECKHVYPITDNIPQMFWPHEKTDEDSDITEIVRAFYEETPFPHYDDHDSVRSLVQKSRKGLYARRLDESIPYNTSLLEVGCGTGQLTNFLGMSCRRVIGADLCLNSLRLGESFRKETGLERVRFMQMNLFRPALKAEQFDVVLCNGVLLTTRDPAEGFRHLTGLVKPGGHIVIGLYNTYGRLATDFRRQIFRVTGGRAKWIDPVLRQKGLSEGKRRAWYADQYCHPHETKQTYGEVHRWFDEAGFEFVRGIPAMRPEDDGLDGASLFQPQPRGSKLDHFLAQAMQIFAPGQKEGGFFVMIGRKPGENEDERRVRIDDLARAAGS